MTCAQLSSDSVCITTGLPLTSKRLSSISDSTQTIDYTRFLWLSNLSDPNSHLLTYRFQAVLFGATSSPFILNAVLHHHLQQYQTNVADDIKHNLYVDNIISGCSSEEAATQYYRQSRQIMKQAKFNLRSWASNSSMLNSLAAQDATGDANATVIILGIQWTTQTDLLHLAPTNPTSINNLVTKREVLQQSCKTFDPIGFATPVTIRAKILIQTLWRRGVDWEKPLDNALCSHWNKSYISYTKALHKICRGCTVEISNNFIHHEMPHFQYLYNTG